MPSKLFIDFARLSFLRVFVPHFGMLETWWSIEELLTICARQDKPQLSQKTPKRTCLSLSEESGTGVGSETGW